MAAAAAGVELELVAAAAPRPRNAALAASRRTAEAFGLVDLGAADVGRTAAGALLGAMEVGAGAALLGAMEVGAGAMEAGAGVVEAACDTRRGRLPTICCSVARPSPKLATVVGAATSVGVRTWRCSIAA